MRVFGSHKQTNAAIYNKVYKYIMENASVQVYSPSIVSIESK